MKKKILAGILAVFVGMTAIVVPSGCKTEGYVPKITAVLSQDVSYPLLDPESNIYKATVNYQVHGTANYYQKGVDQYFPKKLEISWNSTVAADYYNFEIGLKSDLSDATSYVTFDKSLEIPDLFAAKTYYYRITARGGAQEVRSRIFSFKTASLPRTITVPGVSNTRDIGGYYTVDGKYQVKQGMFYRGGVIGAQGVDTLLNVYGIKTDLDVRGDGYASSPLGSSVNYVQCKGPYYIYQNNGINSTDQEYRSALLKEIQTCAVAENYPIYLHCSLGRDRTGTLAFLINALLGVGEKDLYMDYELSFLSASGTADTSHPSNISPFDDFVQYLKDYSTGTLQQNVEKFMLDLGVTANEIASIREIMTEEV